MASKTFTMELEGVDDAIRSMQHLKRTLRNRILRKAMNQATKPLAKSLKANSPRYTGTLRKAIGRKVKSYRSSGVTVGLVGARAGKDRTVVPPGRKKPRKFDPIRYAHLAERSRGFHARTMAGQKGAATAILLREIKSGLAQAARAAK